MVPVTGRYLPVRSPVLLLRRLFLRPFQLYFLIIVLISGLFNDTDFHLFVIIYHYSVVSRLEDYLGKNIVYSTTTFLTSYTDVSREGYGRSHRTTYLDFLNYVVS